MGKQPAAAEASSRQRITSSYSYVAKSLARNFLKLCKQQIDGSLERAKERVEGDRRKGGGVEVELRRHCLPAEMKSYESTLHTLSDSAMQQQQQKKPTGNRAKRCDSAAAATQSDTL